MTVLILVVRRLAQTSSPSSSLLVGGQVRRVSGLRRTYDVQEASFTAKVEKVVSDPRLNTPFLRALFDLGSFLKRVAADVATNSTRNNKAESKILKVTSHDKGVARKARLKIKGNGARGSPAAEAEVES